MKLRIEGTEQEIAALLYHLPSIVDMTHVSPFYFNRGSTTIGRRYVTLIPPELVRDPDYGRGSLP